MKDLKVAIIGAGISGLSCAFELEKYGIAPAIYEKRSQVGDVPGITGIWSRLIIRVNKDPVKYLKKKFNLVIEPMSRLSEVLMISQNKKTTARGNLGYMFRRGIEQSSIEKQIASKVKSPIIFDSNIKLESIKSKFDRIVIATGRPDITKQYNLWTDTFITQVRAAFVLGNFIPGSATVWFNEKYANKVFCYMIPNNEKEATLALIINNGSIAELDYYWSKFLTAEKIGDPIIEQFDMQHNCGFVSSYQNDNIYFVGNAAGLTDDLIGIGSFNAIESGILAGKAIAENIDYNKLIKPISDDIIKLHEFRKAMNFFNNSGFDKLVATVGLPGIKQFIHKNPFLKLRYGLPIVKLYNKLKKNE